MTCQSASKLPAYARFVADSLLEGRVHCELVSEIKAPIPVGLWDDSGIVKRLFALELARKLYFFPLGAGWAFRL